jgi:hypothetical protein
MPANVYYFRKYEKMPRVALTLSTLKEITNKGLREFAEERIRLGEVVWAYVTATMITIVSNATLGAQGKPETDKVLRVGPWNQRWQAVEVIRRSDPIGPPPCVRGELRNAWYRGVDVVGKKIKIGLQWGRDLQP